MESDGLKETFLDLKTILKSFHTLPVSNASGERLFRAIERVKNYLRSTVSQEHLIRFSILYIENDALNHVNYDEVIDNFSTIKTRRMFL